MQLFVSVIVITLICFALYMCVLKGSS